MSDGYEKTVLWATASSTTVSFSYSCLRMVDTLGNEYYPITDGLAGWDEDGQVNGKISLRVYENAPSYIEPCH